MDIEKVFAIVVLTNIAWFITAWSVGYKEGVRDGYNRGRAAGMRVASDRVVK